MNTQPNPAKKRKRIIALSILVILTFALVACRPPQKNFSAQEEQTVEAGASTNATTESNTPGSTDTSSIDTASTSEGDAGTEDSNVKEEAQEGRQVRVTKARAGVLTATRSASVSIEPSQDSRVAASATGQLKSILKREGGLVEKDEVIMSLDDDNAQIQLRNAQLALESARINLNSSRRSTGESGGTLQIQLTNAQSNLNLAKQKYEEGKALLDVGGIARVDVLGLEASYQQAQAGLRQVQDSLAQVNRSGTENLALLEVQVQQAQAQINQAQKAVNDAQVKAPFSCEIAELFIEEGEFVATGSPLFRLVSTDKQLAKFSVPPQDAATLQQNTDIQLRYAGNDYSATITRSSSAPNQQRLIDFVADIAPTRPSIPSGSVAELIYDVELAEGILVPASSVKVEGGDVYLYTIVEGKSQQTPVSIIDEVAGQIAIEGLEADTIVIYPLPPDLRNGATVQIVGEFANDGSLVDSTETTEEVAETIEEAIGDTE